MQLKRRTGSNEIAKGRDRRAQKGKKGKKKRKRIRKLRIFFFFFSFLFFYYYYFYLFIKHSHICYRGHRFFTRFRANFDRVLILSFYFSQSKLVASHNEMPNQFYSSSNFLFLSTMFHEVFFFLYVWKCFRWLETVFPLTIDSSTRRSQIFNSKSSTSRVVHVARR